MYILGVSCFYHDAAAALLHDGDLVAASEEERFSRKKHDSGFPKHAIEFCLRQAGITAADLDYVVFYEKPLLKFDRILRSSLATAVQRGGYSVRSPQEVESLLGTELRLLGCSTASCYGRLAQLLGVRRVIEGEVQRLELSTFSLRLAMRDLFSGQSTTPIQERCDVCSTDKFPVHV